MGGFDTRRAAELRAGTAAAAADLAAIDSHDAAATRALAAVRLTRHTLEHLWLPALDALLAGRADGSDGPDPQRDGIV